MDRGFAPFGGGFGRPPFRPFPHPFFPRRFLFPFFFFSPFFFPFFREGEEIGEDRNEGTFATHQAQQGQSLEQVAHAFNMPLPILEEANGHLSNPSQLKQGETVVIPRISHMYCHKTYMERDMPQGAGAGAGSTAGVPMQMQAGNQAIPIPWQQRAPYPYQY